METTTLVQILTHDENFRGVCARVEDKSEFVLITNPEIPLDDTNCVMRVRLPEERVPQLLDLVETQELAVLLDSAAMPASLGQRLAERGYTARGRRYIGLFDPSLLVQPPGSAPRFVAVGPSELKRFTDLVNQGRGRDNEAERLLWSFRLRNILFSAYLAETAEGTQAAFAVFHCGRLARLVGPFPGGIRGEFVVACRLIARAWDRAREKEAQALYLLVAEADVDAVKPLGFRVDESFWIELYAKERAAMPAPSRRQTRVPRR
jgi:hypothetical protein